MEYLEILFSILFIAILGLFIMKIRSSYECFSESKPISIKVKTAIDRNQGLMNVKDKLKDKHGLLFDYGRYVFQSFWMKNTLIPLDIIILDHKYKVLDFKKNAKIKSTKKIKFRQPFRYAIEMNAGSVKKHKIKIGSIINFIHVNKII